MQSKDISNPRIRITAFFLYGRFRPQSASYLFA